MAGSKLCEDLAFNYERIRPGHIDEYGGQTFIPGGLSGPIDCYRHGASIWLPALKCIQAGEGEQRSTPVLS
jgi:hypothetical protein